MRVLIFHNAVSSDASAADRDVLVQADAVAGALAELGHESLRLGCSLDLASAAERIRQLDPDVVFNLVESLAGTDRPAGLVPALLESLRWPYTGSPTEATVLSNHKVIAKELLARADLPTPAWITLDDAGAPRAGQSEAWILKAVGEHASFALDEHCVLRGLGLAELQRRLAEHAREVGRECFAEAYIEGREFNLSVLAGPDGPEVLAPAEIDFSAFPPDKPRVVGQRAKWAEGTFEFENTPRRFDFPAEDRPLLDELSRLAADAWRLFRLAGWARIDFRVDRSGRPWILELNSNPCLSPDAGFAAALARSGIPFAEAVRRMVDDALARSPGSAEKAARRQPVLPPRELAGVSYRYEATPADSGRVRQIVQATDFFSPAEVDVAVELVDERLAKGPASGYHFVFAEEAGRLVGYTCYGPIAATASSFDLYWIVVDKAWQGRGLGRRLMEQSERLIAAAGGVAVYVETSNRPQYLPTRAFYERFGYCRAALLPDFYGPGDDKVVYVRQAAAGR